ncbi:hypothetical protein GJV85_08820 [Sulfurimonas aquatica]|uniref:Uncharacterized protein n=1 Tax=Sulfurimonas aquatica TaxID=2672570 RepID=A0A975B157_9BACT|nr:hypothetical protein [Sulfurimonas aquatica]QSZ42210.1 hypothetical protein GJV85_08820 [Sulfurimonas aquatica]
MASLIISIESFLEELNYDVGDTILHINMDMEPWEVGELVDSVYPILRQKIPQVKLEVNGYRTYEEEYGGFLAHGVLTIDTKKLNKKDINFIREVIFQLS